MTDSRPDLDEARRRAADAAPARGGETVPLDRAAGRRLAAAVAALADIPHYASSAMDGWAVAGDPPWTVRSAGPVAAGECVRIVTGGAIPDGVDAVLRDEHAERIGAEVRIAAGGRPPRRGEHIRPSASEARRDEVLIPAGVVLSPAHVALAASAGHDRLEVASLPRVALILTGDEVVETGLPQPGRVRDSFGPVLPAAVDGLGGVVVSTTRVPDDSALLRAAIDRSTGSADVVITTGGTGRSRVDHLRGVLDGLGARALVDGVRMRPGAPTVLSRLADGRVLLGLPGNPLAALTVLVTVGGPLLAMGGASSRDEVRVPVGEDVEGRAGTTLVIPCREDGSGAIPVAHRGAAMMRGLAEASGLLVVPAEGLHRGDAARAIRLPWTVPGRG